MASKNSKDLRLLLHPYIFVLKEGNEINKDLLNYSLLMLHVSCPETLKSPEKQVQKPGTLISEFDLIKATFQRQPGS